MEEVPAPAQIQVAWIWPPDSGRRNSPGPSQLIVQITLHELTKSLADYSAHVPHSPFSLPYHSQRIESPN